jgi:hypothetical protein
MLPMSHQQQYQALRERLQSLLDGASNLDRGVAVSAVSEAQEFFQSQVVSLPTEGLALADRSRTQSYNTELHKQLRLLATDVMFLGSAKQDATQQQRLNRVGDRLATLLRYCDVLLENDLIERDLT